MRFGGRISQLVLTPSRSVDLVSEDLLFKAKPFDSESRDFLGYCT